MDILKKSYQVLLILYSSLYSLMELTTLLAASLIFNITDCIIALGTKIIYFISTVAIPAAT